MIPTGPLLGVKVLDMSALGPGPFCGMILADHGADVIEVLRPASGTGDPDPAGFVLPASALSSSTFAPKAAPRSSPAWPSTSTCCSRATGQGRSSGEVSDPTCSWRATHG